MISKFKNKKILITGGTGSFGSEFLKYILNSKYKPREIIIFSRDEKKQFDLRNKYKNKELNFILGDIRDYNVVLNILKNIDFVFHAAALKQVPSCEFFPIEAVKTNILGTENLIQAANRTGVKKIIFLSTDKSVEPINAMGMSKALMEKTIIANSRNNRKGLDFCITRYGNVIGSRGSVIPTFIEQVKLNKKLTITNPKMTRFMMTLKEAVELVIYAFNVGKNGDIFVKKSPASDILTIARAVSKKLNKNLNYSVIGTRLGEKQHESLLSSEEFNQAENLKNFYKINYLKKKVNFNDYFYTGKKTKPLGQYNSQNTRRLNLKETIKIIEKSNIF